MALGGIGEILITAPLTSSEALARLRCLLQCRINTAIVADHPAVAGELVAVAEGAGRRLNVLERACRSGCRPGAHRLHRNRGRGHAGATNCGVGPSGFTRGFRPIGAILSKSARFPSAAN